MVYVANFVRSRSTWTVSCSKDWLVVEKDYGTAQLEDSVIMPRQDLFTTPVALKHSASCVRSFFVTEFERANRSLMISVSKIAIYSSVLA